MEQAVGPVIYADYLVRPVRRVLTQAMDRGETIYSAAYIMPSAGSLGHERKHRNHLALIERMMADELPARLAEAGSMQRAFDLILAYPTIGDFLAYQYVTDVNYSRVTNFTEMEFVVPGPGAIDGIRKCFADTGGLNDAEVIRFMADRQEIEFERLGLRFPDSVGPAAAVDRLPESVLRGRQVRPGPAPRHRRGVRADQDQAEVPGPPGPDRLLVSPEVGDQRR